MQPVFKSVIPMKESKICMSDRSAVLSYAGYNKKGCVGQYDEVSCYSAKH